MLGLGIIETLTAITAGQRLLSWVCGAPGWVRARRGVVRLGASIADSPTLMPSSGSWMAVKTRSPLPPGTDVAGLLSDASLAYIEPCTLVLQLFNHEDHDLTIREIVLARTSHALVDLTKLDVISHTTIQAGGRGTEGSFSVGIPGTAPQRIALLAQSQKGQPHPRLLWERLPPHHWIEFALSIHPEASGVHQMVIEVEAQSAMRTFKVTLPAIRMMVIDSYQGFRHHHMAAVGEIHSVQSLHGAAPDLVDLRLDDNEHTRTYRSSREVPGAIWVTSGFTSCVDGFLGNVDGP